MDDTGGYFNGYHAQEHVKTLLRMKHYLPNRATSLADLMASRRTLFAVPGQFAEQCKVPLVAPCHRNSGRNALVDFVVLTGMGEVVLLSVKSQAVNGTCDEKLEYEVQQLIATELPAALLVLGPMKGRDGPEGWRPHILGEIWERARYHGANRVLLFRRTDKFDLWAQAGFPVAGQGRTSAHIFAEYCDREP